MSITERQSNILNCLIEEYIESAKPVSSQLLQDRHNFGIKPASIRLEMQRLTDDGYIMQPHTSSGRVPTDKGYRFFVDELLEDDFDYSDPRSWFIDEETEDSIKFIQSVTKKLAQAAETLVLTYLEKEKILWKEGWEEVLREPEFSEQDCTVNFAEFLESFEEMVAETSFFSRLPAPSRGSAIEDLKVNSEIKIFIGKENPLKNAGEFSIIISRCHLPGDDESIVSILGPKRMDYDKNIGLMSSLRNALENL
ncbi:MAG: hypothetical protein G01um101430_200 [Parcubacteria group bacterium Gr01-1014_30]|nr:MAG: hypothetical protein G01um101430_200 [Parcubacteria group bacterium Gr01-1014_30]